MLSRAPSTRYISMAVVIIAGLIFAAPYSGYALLIDRTFEIKVCDPGPECPDDLLTMATPEEVGTFSGRFRADTGSDDMLVFSEFMPTDIFTATWECTKDSMGMCIVDSAPPLITFELSDLEPASVFKYDISDDAILELDLALMIGAIFRCQSSPAVAADGSLVPCTPGPLGPPPQPPVNHYLFVFQDDLKKDTFLITSAKITPVPEASTTLLLSISLVGMLGYASFSRRVRSAAHGGPRVPGPSHGDPGM